jgi:hypothetical protein
MIGSAGGGDGGTDSGSGGEAGVDKKQSLLVRDKKGNVAYWGHWMTYEYLKEWAVDEA